MLSGANEFDNIWWFNKELSDKSLNTLFLLKFLTAKPADQAKVQKLYKDLSAAKLKAAYKCNLFVGEFEKKPVTKKSAAKGKTAAKTVKTKPAAKKNAKTKKK